MQSIINLEYKGNSYNITLMACQKIGYFEITATHHASGRISSVTNLNRIISDILEPVLGEAAYDIEDSDIQVDDLDEHDNLLRHALEMLGDKDWITNSLEPALDADRVAGEWSRLDR